MYVFYAVPTGTYSVWAVVEYKKTVTTMVNGMPTPGPSAETYRLFSSSASVNVTNSTQAATNPHGTASGLNASLGAQGITSIGQVTNLDSGWKVQSVELYVLPATGGSPTIKKQDYNPATDANPVNWDVTQGGLAAGEYQVYVVITLVNGSDSQQLLLGPETMTVS